MLMTILKLEAGSYQLNDVARNIMLVDTKTDKLDAAIQTIDESLDNDLQIYRITDSLYEIATIYGRVRKGIISIQHNSFI
ncbi:hypothetical protein GCM10008931_43270 [Oceanobacillus oncorhynchi subsp. oncorhynchi]|uniref:hypothetical protein n=1 Tax=Oceanobacillus oncorhynchi TaxID=545501 RepID=UPI0031D0E3E6